MEPIERAVKAIHEVDGLIASVLLPYGVPLPTYFASLTRHERVAPLPVGVVDAVEYLLAHSQMQDDDAKGQRAMGACWRCVFANRIDFETRMTPLLKRRYELELHLCVAKARLAIMCTEPPSSSSSSSLGAATT
jgi:hypothetical protein